MTTPKFIRLKIKDIKPYANNPRVITQEAIDGIAGSIKAYGYISPVCVDQNGVILSGHTTLQAAKKAGLTEIDVVQVDIDETHAMGYRIADNKTAELARWDRDLLIDEARGIIDEAPELMDDLGMADWELKRLYADLETDLSEPTTPKEKHPAILKREQEKANAETFGGVKLMQRCVLYLDKPKDLQAFLDLLGVDSAAKVPITLRASQIFGGI